MRSSVRAVALAVFGLVLAVSGLAGHIASAHEPHPGLNFSIGVQGVSGCNTRASDVTCTLPSGQPFVLEVWLDSLPDDISSYGGFDLYAEYSGVTASNDATNDIWPDCGFPAVAPVEGGRVAWGCAIGLPPAGPSSYVGPIGTVTFTCSQNGTITMVHKAGSKTDLVEAVTESEQSILHGEGANAEEKLTITCDQVPDNGPGVVTKGTPGPPGPTPHSKTPSANTGQTPGTPGPTLEPTAAARATLAAADATTATAEAKGTPDDGQIAGEDGDDGGVGTGVLVAFAAAAVAVVVVGVGGGYWYMRSRGGGGSPPA